MSDTKGKSNSEELILNAEKTHYILTHGSDNIRFRVQKVKQITYGGKFDGLDKSDRYFMLIPEESYILNRLSRDEDFDLMGYDD